MKKLDRFTLGLSFVLCTGISVAGCRAGSGAPDARAPARSEAGSGVLTKEEVGAILGQPVTAVEGKNKHLKYKTDSLFVETTIEVDQRDAVMAMQGARKATTMLGGTPEAVPSLGDEAFFGAMSTLYVRKGDSMALIQAPNYQQQAQMKAMEKVQGAKTADDTRKATEDLQQLSKADPTSAGLQGGDAMQGAVAVVNAASKKQGTDYEAQTRTVALALATKLMEKL